MRGRSRIAPPAAAVESSAMSENLTNEGEPLLLVAHPSPDVYGSDLQLLEALAAARADGWAVHVVLTTPGPLVPLLEEIGARVEILDFPVLRKALLTPRGLAGLALAAAPTVVSLARLIRASGARALLVNTVTIPLWQAAGRLAGVPVISYVHEAEEGQHRLIATGLTAPLALSRGIIANSQTARRVISDVIPGLDSRIAVVYNGVPMPPEGATPLRERASGDPLRITYVGRLAPRKGTDVAVAALGRARAAGVDASLDLYGAVFPGYEWFEEELHARVAADGTGDHVRFHGYLASPWGAYADADIVVMPSRAEPFGNVAIEAMHAGRPVIAAAVQGLTETITPDVTGVHIPFDDDAEAMARSLADAIVRLANDPDLARRIAEQGKINAARRLSTETYRERIAELLRTVK